MKKYSNHFSLKRFYKTCSIMLILQLILFFFSGCSFSSTNQTISKSGFYFNTVIQITLYNDSYESLLEDCFSLADTYEGYFSNTISDSDISKINDANGEFVEVHDETIALLEKGIYYGDLSEGNFDITIGKLSDLWNFSTYALLDEVPASAVPTEAEIKEALKTVDYQGVVIDGNQVALKNPNAKIDLGGIAKGYIADQMKLYLEDHGVTSGMINLGGNVLTLGKKSDGSSYTIGIQKPFSQDGEVIASVEVTNQTVVSSGVYERYYEVGENFYHHILDPKTGYPYDNGLLSVSIICENSVDGDGLSTTCFSLGLEDGMALIESLDDVEAIFITDDYELHVSSGIGTTIPLSEK
ncbi:MAG: FAD:protein FMN transferase [Roseburia sp.]